MSQHPANLALRFLLEIAAVVSLGMWGWSVGTGAARVLAVLVPVLAAAAWTQLSYPGDPVHDGARFVVPTQLRLVVELVVLVGGWLALRSVAPGLATWVGIGVLVHHVLSWDRVLGMLRGEGS